MTRRINFLTLVFFLCVSPSLLQAEELDDLWKVKRSFEKVWTNYNLSSVRLQDGSVFKTRQDQHLQYLLSLDEERLINNVMRAGGISTTAENYGGWQHDNGNGFGNYMSGCSQMYASTGNEQLKERVSWMIDIIEECQQKQDLGGWFHFSRTKAFYDQLMSARGNGCYPTNNGEDFYTNTDMCSMVFYQLHRIYYGIRDAYYYAGIEKAKTVFLNCMSWACTWTELIGNDASMQMALEAEHGGMLELFMDAYALSGNERYLNAGKRWIQSLNFRDKMADGVDVLTSRHSNVYDPKFLGLLREYELTGDEINRLAAVNTWDIVRKYHILPQGGHGRWERYGQEGRLLDELAVTSSETCCTNNMLRFSKALFSDFGDSKYMDFYERALYNHILSTKDPKNNSVGGGFSYYQGLLPGMHRNYMDDNSFYCCWETALENHSKYGEAIYFHNDNDILVNLYIPSILTDVEHGFSMKMDGDYPAVSKLTYTITENKDFAGNIHFRIPDWMDASSVQVQINGQKAVLVDLESRLPYISAVWKAGDVITLDLPVGLRTEDSEEPDIAAIFYGPLLLAPNMGRVSNDYGGTWGQTAVLSPCDYPTFTGNRSKLSDWMQRSGDGLTFKATGVGKTYTFQPLYDCNHIATSIYQRFTGTDDEERTVMYVPDKVRFGFETSREASGRSVIKDIYNRYYIRVNAKAYVQYTMKLSPEPDMQHYVAIKYDGWETDTLGNFSVFVDGVYIGEAGPCEKSQQFCFPTVFFKIPVELTTGKTTVKVKLQQGTRAMNFFALELVTERYLQEMCPESKDLYGKEAKSFRLEAEAAQPHESNRSFDGKSSGGAFISRFATYLQWNTIYIPESQDYDLVICRRGSGNVNYNIKVGNATTTFRMPASVNTWGEYTVRIHLEKGFNTLNISPASGRTPFDIDYIELVPVSPEATESPLVSDVAFYVYPNPADGTVYFKVGDDRKGTIRIVDMKGSVCARLSYPQQNTYDVASLPEGMYEVLLVSGKNILSTKLIVQK